LGESNPDRASDNPDRPFIPPNRHFPTPERRPWFLLVVKTRRRHIYQFAVPGDMNTEQGELYILLAEEDGEWERPIPARDAIRDAVVAATDLEETEVHDLDAYLDPERLRGLLEGDGEYTRTFRIEGHDVTVTADGEITVE